MELPLKMRQEYLSRRRHDLETLRAPGAPFKTLGHQLRGNARSYGFAGLEPLAVRMEALDENSPQQSVMALIEEFKNYLDIEEQKLSKLSE